MCKAPNSTSFAARLIGLAVSEILVECSLLELYSGKPLLEDTIIFARSAAIG